MPVRCQQRCFDGFRRNLLGTQQLSCAALPVSQRLPRPLDIAQAQSQLNFTEMVAELTKAHAEVKHAHGQQEAEEDVHLRQHKINQPQRQHWQQHRHQPGGNSVAALSGIELLGNEIRPMLQWLSDHPAIRQRLVLLDEKNGNQGKKIHAKTALVATRVDRRIKIPQAFPTKNGSCRR